jgi:hypothetical protein
MSDMIRKQFYIHKRHQALLTKLARAKGVSEAEIIRQAIEHEASDRNQPDPRYERTAWEEILTTVEARKTLSEQAVPFNWDRRDAFEEYERHLLPSAR